MLRVPLGSWCALVPTSEASRKSEVYSRARSSRTLTGGESAAANGAGTQGRPCGRSPRSLPRLFRAFLHTTAASGFQKLPSRTEQVNAPRNRPKSGSDAAVGRSVPVTNESISAFLNAAISATVTADKASCSTSSRTLVVSLMDATLCTKVRICAKELSRIVAVKWTAFSGVDAVSSIRSSASLRISSATARRSSKSCAAAPRFSTLMRRGVSTERESALTGRGCLLRVASKRRDSPSRTSGDWDSAAPRKLHLSTEAFGKVTTALRHTRPTLSLAPGCKSACRRAKSQGTKTPSSAPAGA
eukprot:scaffold273_cov242-Pinguiococcus_pyrenoidosus.AAC.26